MSALILPSIIPGFRALCAVAFTAALLSPIPAAAAVIAEGTYTVTDPDSLTVRFTLLLTATGARITPESGETLVFSYGRRSVLVIDRAEHSYFPLPLDLLQPLLAAGFGYSPDGTSATVTGKTRTILGLRCGEVLIQGSAPALKARIWRIADPAWSADYSLFERSLGLPWTLADPPPELVGIPLRGQVEIRGRRPYRASWEITGIRRDAGAGEDFSIPAGYRMDLERLLSLQGQP